MRLYLYKNKTNVKEYSVRLIERLLGQYMVDDPASADYVLVSICDVTEVGDIVKARAHGRPVIAGGMISEYPLLNELADYVWHGEIYGFRDALAAGTPVPDMASITSRDKRDLVIDQRIAWRENPIVRVGARAMYYYVAKGCPVRCKYCYIGNVRKYQTVPEARYRKALRAAGKNLMPIAAYNPYGVPAGANVGETLLKRYVAGEGATRAKMIRSGVEFVTPDLSRNLAKGVTIEDVNEALARSKAEGTKMILYHIAGVETQDAIDDFFSSITTDYATTPAVSIVYTYIDPQPFTPFIDFDLRRKVTGIDTKRVYRIVSERNKRFRVMPLAGPEKSTVRTLLARATSEEDYRLVKSLAKLRHDEMLERIEGRTDLMGCAGLEEICARPRKAIAPAYWRISDAA
jgi:hypothetical protein